MGAALEIRTDLASPTRLRRLARREGSPRTATRLLAIARAMEGASRTEAARLAGMERQALRDAVVRFNAEGLDGLRDGPKPGRFTDPKRCRLRFVLGGLPAARHDVRRGPHHHAAGRPVAR